MPESTEYWVFDCGCISWDYWLWVYFMLEGGFIMEFRVYFIDGLGLRLCCMMGHWLGVYFIIGHWLRECSMIGH